MNKIKCPCHECIVYARCLAEFDRESNYLLETIIFHRIKQIHVYMDTASAYCKMYQCPSYNEYYKMIDKQDKDEIFKEYIKEMLYCAASGRVLQMAFPSIFKKLKKRYKP